MQLVADRFAVRDEGRAFDLATGAPVTLIVGSAGGISEQLRWTARCDALYSLRHPAMAPLLDYGLIGDCSRFEAWGCGDPSRERDVNDAVHSRVTGWLRACGLSIGHPQSHAVCRSHNGNLVWLPDSGTGYPTVPEDPSDAMPIAVRGLQIIQQPAVPILAEMFHAVDARPRMSALWGAAGSGKRVIAGELARIARSDRGRRSCGAGAACS
jgi:hypothetical protein